MLKIAYTQTWNSIYKPYHLVIFFQKDEIFFSLKKKCNYLCYIKWNVFCNILPYSCRKVRRENPFRVEFLFIWLRFANFLHLRNKIMFEKSKIWARLMRIVLEYDSSWANLALCVHLDVILCWHSNCIRTEILTCILKKIWRKKKKRKKKTEIDKIF